METKFSEHSEVHGPCKSCGKPAVAPIPLHYDATDKNSICGWPTTTLPRLSCISCAENLPLVPVPIVYWSGDWVGLALDGPRPASYILRMVLSWIADGYRSRGLPESSLVRVFCSIDALSYVLREAKARSFYTDIRSRLTPHWDFEVIALTQFLDDALALNEPVLAYGLLVDLIKSYVDFYSIQEIRDALELIAHACGDEPFSSRTPMTALEHFEHLKSEFDEHRPFRELDRFDIIFETPLSVETGGPIKGTFNAVVQNPPERFAVSDVCCRLLCGVTFLRHFADGSGQQLSGALTAEGKAEMTLRSHWTDLEISQRAAISQVFNKVTGLDLAQTYNL